MALSLPTPNHSSSSSFHSHFQPLLPATQQLHTRIKSQQNLHHSADTSSSSLLTQGNTCTGLPLFISGEASTTPHQDQVTTSYGRRIATFDLNSPPSELDVGGQDNIPQRIRLTKLKQLARANKKVEERRPGSDGRKDAGTSNSMEAHLSNEVNPRVGVEEEKSERAGGVVKNISDVIKTVSSRNDVLSVLLSPNRADYILLLQTSDSV